MRSYIQKYWAVLLGAAIIAGGLIILPGRAQAPAYAQVTQPTPLPASIQPSVSVSGAGSVNVQPDRAIVDIGVQTDGQTASAALNQNNTQMQAVLAALQKANIASADMQTLTVQLTPRYATPTMEPQTQPQTAPQAQATGTPTASGAAATASATPSNGPVGYTATNTVEVTVRNLSSLGTLLDQVVAAGGNQIEGIRFDVSNPTQAMDQARDAAMKDALHKAQQLATLGNAKLGPVLTISENSSAPIPFAAARANAAPQAVPVAPGTQTVTVNLQVTWELLPQP